MNLIVFPTALQSSPDLLLLRRALVDYSVLQGIPMTHTVTNLGFTVTIDDPVQLTQWLLQWDYTPQEFYIHPAKKL